jgi:hypothetical protein
VRRTTNPLGKPPLTRLRAAAAAPARPSSGAPCTPQRVKVTPSSPHKRHCSVLMLCCIIERVSTACWMGCSCQGPLQPVRIRSVL